MRRALLPLATALLCAAARDSWACPSCFGQADGPMADATRVGMWLLLGVTVSLQGGFAAFFLYLRRRAAGAAERALDDEWSRLQEGSDRGGRSGTR